MPFQMFFSGLRHRSHEGTPIRGAPVALRVLLAFWLT